ncbi:MAG: hypothetical protein MUC86_16650 [Burkholderiaceae bacterium]|nr:hypothetical protein [Burkholderiaceae bacterium]
MNLQGLSRGFAQKPEVGGDHLGQAFGHARVQRRRRMKAVLAEQRGMGDAVHWHVADEIEVARPSRLQPVVAASRLAGPPGQRLRHRGEQFHLGQRRKQHAPDLGVRAQPLGQLAPLAQRKAERLLLGDVVDAADHHRHIGRSHMAVHHLAQHTLGGQAGLGHQLPVDPAREPLRQLARQRRGQRLVLGARADAGRARVAGHQQAKLHVPGADAAAALAVRLGQFDRGALEPVRLPIQHRGERELGGEVEHGIARDR